MTQPPEPNSQPDSGQSPQGDDPLASLYKMSRTAGLGSQEYIAVNPTAVASLLVGLASVLALLFGTILLIIPIIAVILAIVAIRQIRQSAGTQAGVGIAIMGLLVALLFVAAVGGKAMLHARHVAAVQGDIAELIGQAGQHIRAENYDAAYILFSTGFHDRVKKEAFANTWARLQAQPTYGKIKGMRWSGFLDVQTDPDGAQIARGLIIIDLESTGEDRHMGLFRQQDGAWRIDEIFELPFTAAAPMLKAAE